MKEIFVITCGTKYEITPDPGMAKEEREKIRSMRLVVPKMPSKIVCGTGRRHQQIIELLGLIANHQNLDLVSILGGPEIFYTTSVRFNMKPSKMVMLSSGNSYPARCFKRPEESSSGAIRLIGSLPDLSLVCTETSFLKLLGIGEPRECSLYEMAVAGKEIRSSRIRM